MIRVEICLLTNNIVLPFQNIRENHFLDFPISHIIGGFHLASASDKRIKITLEYLNSLNMFNDTLYLFPIHCSGEKFIEMANTTSYSRIKAFNPSVGTTFHF